MDCLLVSGMQMFAPIQEGDSFAFVVQYLTEGNAGFASTCPTRMHCPRSGVLGIVSHRLSPKDWTPRGSLWPKNFVPIVGFKAGHLSVSFNGGTHTLTDIAQGGSIGVFIEEKAIEEQSVASEDQERYPDIDSGE